MGADRARVMGYADQLGALMDAMQATANVAENAGNDLLSDTLHNAAYCIVGALERLDEYTLRIVDKRTGVIIPVELHSHNRTVH